MSQDEFTRLFQYMQQKFDAIDNQFEQVNNKVNRLTNTVDAYAKKVDDYSLETAMLSHRANRHEGWINQISVETGVQLNQV
jgi:hypothetical protein